MSGKKPFFGLLPVFLLLCSYPLFSQDLSGTQKEMLTVVSLITIVSVTIAIGQYKGKTDQKITGMDKDIGGLKKEFKEHEKQALLTEAKLRDEFKEEAASLRKDLAQSTNAMQDLKVLFTNFSSRMDTQMQYIQGDLKDIKEKFNAKEK